MLRTNVQADLIQYALECGSQPALHHEISQWTLPSRSQGAVEAWRRGMNSLYEQAGYGTALTLTDARRSILPPLAYATVLSSVWVGHLHRRLHSRNAILCAPLPLPQAELALHGLPGYGNNVIRFFEPSDRMSAIRWLVSDD